MKHVILLLLAMGGSCGFAQDRLCYLVKNEGDTLRGNNLHYREPILQAPYFELDSATIKWDESRLIRNQHGIFANVSSLNKGREAYALRIHGGSLSVFERVDMSVYGSKELPQVLPEKEAKRVLAQGSMDYLMTSDERIIRPNYKSMLDVMNAPGAAPEAVVHLKRMRNFQVLRISLLSTGAGLLGAGGVQAAVQGGINPALVLGAIAAGASFLTRPAIDDSRWQAVEAYNAYTTSP